MPTDTHTPTRSLAPTFLGVAAALLVCAVLIIGGLVARPAGGLKLPKDYTVVHVDEFDYGFHMAAGPLPAGQVAVRRHQSWLDPARARDVQDRE